MRYTLSTHSCAQPAGRSCRAFAGVRARRRSRRPTGPGHTRSNEREEAIKKLKQKVGELVLENDVLNAELLDPLSVRKR
jgi:hypothetical protein